MTATNYFCADIQTAADGTLSNKTRGHFSLSVNKGRSKYLFEVNLSDVTNCDFNLYPTVAYHIHTFSVQNPEKIPIRSCSNTGEHYDPNLACGEKSESHTTRCTHLNRTAAAGFDYRCITNSNLEEYVKPTGVCEVGDLSGKFGRIKVGADQIAKSNKVYKDLLPPYVYNFRNPTANITEGWASVVFHCGDPPGTRIACGDFYKTRAIKAQVQAHMQAVSIMEFQSGCYDFP